MKLLHVAIFFFAAILLQACAGTNANPATQYTGSYNPTVVQGENYIYRAPSLSAIQAYQAR